MFESTFSDMALEELERVAKAKHDEGYRFVQMLCTAADPGIDLVYSFMKRRNDGVFALENYRIRGLNRDTQTVPSVTSWFLSAFPFENEAHDLFGVKVEGNAIDFAGRFYQVSMDTPMTVISPAQKAAREKAARVAAAKAAKEAKEKAAASGELSAAATPADIDAERAALEKRLEGMDAEKAAKVRAAFEAKMTKRAAEAAAQKGGE